MPVIPPQRKKISPEILRKLAQAELGIYQTTTPIRRRAQSVAPLSYPQVRVWFIDQLEPESTVYIIPLAWRFRGDLDKAALQTAVNEIIRRHEALRTTFAFVEGAPLQRIHAPSPLPLQVVDLQSLAPEQREKEALRQLQEASRRPFDLRQGPVFRAALFQLAVEEHLFLLTMHHIVSDGWSQGILLRELAILYNAFRAGKSSPLPELPVQYADYALWQRELLQGEVLERQASYWKSQLAGAPTLLELPTDRPRPHLQTSRGAILRRELSPELTQKLKALGQQEEATPFMTLLAAFQALLSRYSGQDQILVGTPIANRTQPEMEGLIGFFLNTLVLRGDLSGDPNFREFLRRVRETALGAYAHQDLPFEKLVEELSPERSLSHSPLFQVLFIFQNAPRGTDDLDGLKVEALQSEGVTAKFDLNLIIAPEGNGLRVSLEYNTDLFDGDRIERMLGHFQTLLQAIVADPDREISRLPLLTETEKQQILVAWNQTQQDFPTRPCLHQLIQEQAQRTPEAIAAQFEHQQLTYQELNHRANQLAHFLQEQGIGPEQMVGLCVERSLEMLVGMLGILKAGAAYLPLDPAYPQERLAFLLEDAQAPLLITKSPLREHFPAYQGQRFCLDTEGHLLDPYPADTPVSNVTADNLAYLIYTSGSTGRPKGVAIAHASATRLLQWAATRYSPEELSGVLASTSLCFDLSVFEIFLPLSVGGKILLAPNALALPQMPARDQVTLINTVPSAIAELLNQGAIPPSVRTVNLAGEPLSTELADRLYAAGVGKVYDLYGPSEDTTYSTFTLRRAHAPATIGRPISNTQLYLLDARMQPVPVGVVGEIYLGGEGLARGYLNRAELTSERFVADPFGTPGGRLYRTGDLGKYCRDGNVGFLGRMDHQVKIRGFRIELGEIERRLREHERVAEAVVLAREDDPDQKRLVAYVVLREGGLGVGELRGHLGVTLPEYMIPSAFVFLEALPLTPNGKIDRKALPAPEMQHPEANYVAPRTPTEELLVGLWAELLKVQPIGIHDNFFDLGGHSLLATRVVARILSDLHIDIPMRTLFERPTIAGLVEAIEAANPTQSDHARTPLVPVTRDRALPLSFAQQRLWFIDQLESARTTYLVPLVLRLRGALHVETLRRVLETIVARHEVLRTLFPRLEGDPIQRIAAQAELRLSVFDLSKLPPAIRGPEADRRITEEARVPFSLADGPLIRCLLVRMDAEEHRLVVVMHHIITDGWSQGVFLQELTALYNAFSMDAPSPLPALPIQYADYAVWQREWLRGEALERQLSYWKEHLSGAPALLELPTDHPRPPVQTFQGASQHRKLSAQLTQQIKALAQREGSTLFMTLLSAFYVLLARYSGQEDIVVGTPIANRTRAEVEGLIGFFVNTLALRGDLSGDPSFRDLLDRVRRVALSAYAHQDLPFEKLVEELSPTRTLSYSPIFQAMFALQNMTNRNHAPGALQIEEMEIESVAAKFDLSLIATESASGLNLTLEYSTDLFQTDRMERMLAHFQNLLQSIVTEPQLPVSRLNLLSETERHQLLVEYNTPQIYFQPELCLHQLIQHRVAQTPEAIAVTFEDQHLTYQQLNARANQLAHYLIDQGVGPDRLVGLYVERSLEMVVGILGILKAGAAYLPLDPSYPQERIAYMLEDSQAALLLIQRSLQQNLTELPVPSFCLDTEAEILASYPTEDPETSVTPDNLAYVIYTS